MTEMELLASASTLMRTQQLKRPVDESVRPATATRKRCGHCQQEKSAVEFSVDMSRGDGLRGWCKACEAEARSNRYKKRKAAAAAGQSSKKRSRDVEPLGGREEPLVRPAKRETSAATIGRDYPDMRPQAFQPVRSGAFQAYAGSQAQQLARNQSSISSAGQDLLSGLLPRPSFGSLSGFDLHPMNSSLSGLSHLSQLGSLSPWTSTNTSDLAAALDTRNHQLLRQGTSTGSAGLLLPRSGLSALAPASAPASVFGSVTLGGEQLVGHVDHLTGAVQLVPESANNGLRSATTSDVSAIESVPAPLPASALPSPECSWGGFPAAATAGNASDTTSDNEGAARRAAGDTASPPLHRPSPLRPTPSPNMGGVSPLLGASPLLGPATGGVPSSRMSPLAPTFGASLLLPSKQSLPKAVSAAAEELTLQLPTRSTAPTSPASSYGLATTTPSPVVEGGVNNVAPVRTVGPASQQPLQQKASGQGMQAALQAAQAAADGAKAAAAAQALPPNEIARMYFMMHMLASAQQQQQQQQQ